MPRRQQVTELVSFEGIEIYLQEVPELNGLQFHEILFAFDGAIPIGVADSRGTTINPKADRVLRGGEYVVVVAADDDTFRLRPNRLRRRQGRSVHRDALPPPLSYKPLLSTLFVNWHPEMRTLLQDFDALVSPGSSVTLFSRMTTTAMKRSLVGGGAGKLVLNNLSVKFCSEAVAELEALETLPLEECVCNCRAFFRVDSGVLAHTHLPPPSTPQV